MNRELVLRRRIKRFTGLFVVGLVLSGATAIPLEMEMNWLVRFTGAQPLVAAPGPAPAPDWAQWLVRVQGAIQDTATRHPFMAYGTDWLAFGHFVIALAFIGALRDPVRNAWLYTFGILACGLVIPYALVFGAMRGIPLWWRCIDCSFGVFGLIPLGLCRRWLRQLPSMNESPPRSIQ